MMKKLFIAFLINISLIASAQTTNDPDAKAILDAVSAKFKTFKTVQAAFTYRVENAAAIGSTTTGSIQMKGLKYRVSFGEQEIYCDGNVVWNFNKAAKEVTISQLDASGGMITPQKLFSNFYDKDFIYKLNGEKKNGKKSLMEIEMTPVDKSKTFHKVYLQVDKSAKTIYTTKVLENGGNRITWTVSSMKTNIPLDDKVFVFDKSKYPGVEEVDLR